jgi:acetyl esterase/lipase
MHYLKRLTFWILSAAALVAVDNPKLKVFDIVPPGQTPALKQVAGWLKAYQSDHAFTADMPNPVFRISDLDFLGESRKEKLDLYLPLGEATRLHPGVLFIHGGGFTGGDKAENRTTSVSADLARAGYVVVSCNYLLSHKEHPAVWPQNVADCRQAIRWMREHAKELNLDEKRIAVAGGSAGGYLALMVGLAPEQSELGGDPQARISSSVAAVIDFYGVTQASKHGKATLAGTGPEAEKRFMPATYAREGVPPVLVLHGDADTTVDIGDSRQLVAALRAAKVDHEFLVVKGGVHTFDLHPKGKSWTSTAIRWEQDKEMVKESQSSTPDITEHVLAFLERTIGR